MNSRYLLRFACLSLLIVVFFGLRQGVTDAVSDTCSTGGIDVDTSFNATYPTTVKAGQNFKVSSIRSTPETSFGVTVHSSIMEMTATNASPASYNKQNTHTDPSPTTGQLSYTAYFPDWNLKATGAVGSTITLKLKSAVSTIDNGAGGTANVVCNFSATLAVITIVADSAQVPTNTTVDTSEQEEEIKAKEEEETKTAEEELKKSVIAELNINTEAQLRNVSIQVKDSKNRNVKGASVVLDDQLVGDTNDAGIAVFENVRIGSHRVKVSFDNKVAEQEIEVKDENEANQFAVTLPRKLNFKLAAIILSAAALSVGVLLFLNYVRTRHSQP